MDILQRICELKVDFRNSRTGYGEALDPSHILMDIQTYAELSTHIEVNKYLKVKCEDVSKKEIYGMKIITLSGLEPEYRILECRLFYATGSY